jgi:paraquat-inducible protein B
MKRQANATLIGAFLVIGLALITLALITVAGSKLFTRKDRAVMHFSGSVYGLQLGAPVVFRGVRVRTVAAIEVFYDRSSDSFSIPVVVELDGDAVGGLDGKRTTVDVALALPALVQRGLTAQLSMQSVLTGLFYVDLDLRPQAKRHVRGGYRELVEIPTTASGVQALQTQLESMDFRRLAEDVWAIASSAPSTLSGPELKQALVDLSQITANFKRLSGRLDKRIDTLADDVQRALRGARATLQNVGQAALGVNQTADRFGALSDQACALLAPQSPLILKLQSATDEVARSAAALRQSTATDSPLMRNTEQTMHDLSRASRALRDLAETLEQHPEALLRGRGVAP